VKPFKNYHAERSAVRKREQRENVREETVREDTSERTDHGIVPQKR